jgi:zinc protease
MNLKEYAAKIQILKPVPGVTVYLDERKGSGYVHASASVRAGQWRTDASHPMLPLILSQMLDEGTVSRPRDTLRSELESLGSEIRFDIGGEFLFARIEGRASVFKETLDIFADMMLHPLLSRDSFDAVRVRLASEFEEDKEDTRKIALSLATQSILKKGSALAVLSPDEKIVAMNVTLDEVRNHAADVLRGELVVVVVGDQDAGLLTRCMRESFSSWNADPGTLPMLPIIPLASLRKETAAIIKGKENVDVYFAAMTDIRSKDDEYVSLSIASELLGSGGFTGHLMKTVRERDGLTYGIYSRLRETSTSYPLMATIWATFGNKVLKAGIAATKKEIAEWISKHITEKNLTAKKKEVLGSFIVSLQDPDEMAQQLCSIVASGRSLNFLAEYPELVAKLTARDVARSAKKYLSPESFAVASAGTI